MGKSKIDRGSLVYDDKQEMVALCTKLVNKINSSKINDFHLSVEEGIVIIAEDVLQMAKDIKNKAAEQHQEMLDKTVNNIYDWA